MRRRRFLLTVYDHISRVHAVQSYPVRNWSLFKLCWWMSNLWLLRYLNLLQFDLISRNMRTPTILLSIHNLMGIKIDHLFMHILTILMWTTIIDRFECKIFLRNILLYRGNGNFVSMINLRHSNRCLRFYIYNLCCNLHVLDRLSCTRKCRIIMHPKLIMRV